MAPAPDSMIAPATPGKQQTYREIGLGEHLENLGGGVKVRIDRIAEQGKQLDERIRQLERAWN